MKRVNKEEVMKRTFVIRHLSRDKKNEADPQTPTLMGAVEAFVMGYILAKEFACKFVRVMSSPQPRAMRTARIILRAMLPLDCEEGLPTIEATDGLNDFSSDPRFAAVKKPFKAAKGTTDIESEQAVFLAGGAVEDLRVTKLAEAIAVIDGIYTVGSTLVTLHGATVDGLFAHYAKRLDAKAEPGMLAFGRMIGKCEGFVLSYDDAGALASITKVERPMWLNAVAALIGGSGD